MIIDSISCDKVSDNGLEATASLLHLEHLVIEDVHITDHGLQCLVNIKIISCSGCFLIQLYYINYNYIQ